MLSVQHKFIQLHLGGVLANSKFWMPRLNIEALEAHKTSNRPLEGSRCNLVQYALDMSYCWRLSHWARLVANRQGWIYLYDFKFSEMAAVIEFSRPPLGPYWGNSCISQRSCDQATTLLYMRFGGIERQAVAWKSEEATSEGNWTAANVDCCMDASFKFVDWIRHMLDSILGFLNVMNPSVTKGKYGSKNTNLYRYKQLYFSDT